MSGRKFDAENLNKKQKNFNEEDDIGRRKCRTKIPIDKYNEEGRGWTYSSKIQNVLLIIIKRKRRIV